MAPPAAVEERAPRLKASARPHAPFARSVSIAVPAGTVPSRLSHTERLARSTSQPVAPGLHMSLSTNTCESSLAASSNDGSSGSILDARDRLCNSPEAVVLVDDDEGTQTGFGAEDVEDSSGVRAAKRIKTTGSDFRPAIAGPDVQGDGGKEDDSIYQIVPGSPMPPTRRPMLPKNSLSAHGWYEVEEKPEHRASGLVPPAIATRVPPPRQVLGFSPWSGQHQEDVLNESSIKSGYIDKAPASGQTDSGSARTAIWPILGQRNHSALQMMSYLYTQVMEKRLALSRCVAAPTFKPPPRVTVTDNKRESWLRDLANPNVPLRKQSRTIPHGIRSTTLMEQCLSKNVPWQRAIWLSKCVGANEMRAFRRKGMGGASAASKESKWVREWTISVEKFLAGIVAACGQPDWKDNMEYCLRFISALYSEELLDRGHFLNWLVSSFASSSLPLLATWTLLIQSFWPEMTKYGRRARKLAEATLGFLQHTAHGKSEGYTSLRRALQKIVNDLQRAGGGCLLVPANWEKFKGLLTTPKSPNAAHNDSIAENIAMRNNRLVRPNYRKGATARSPLSRLYSVLDSVDVAIDPDRLIATCRTLIPDGAKLTSALLNWATTPYRSGISRVYLAARLISQLHRSGVDTDAAVLRHLTNPDNLGSMVVENAQRTISELVRLQAFSVGKYLQWLIGTGPAAPSEQLKSATSIVVAVPTDSLSVPLRNTIRTMSLRLGCPDSPATVAKASADAREAVQTASSQHCPSVVVPDSLSLSAKLNISLQVREMIGKAAKDGSLSIEAFCVARAYLEDIQDLSSLAEITRAAASISKSSLLATVSDTICIHASAFAAIGTLNSLIEAAKERYIAMRMRHALDRTLILSFIALVKRTHKHIVLARTLADDLAQCDQQNSLAVCSPASDSLVTMQATTLESAEQIDAVFASGNTMDEALMERVFNRILLWVSKPNSPSGMASVSRECEWLNRLRVVDPNAYDKLVKNTLAGFVKGAGDRVVSSLTVVTLVVSGTVSLSSFAQVAPDATSHGIARDALRLFTDADLAVGHLSAVERHRFRVQQQLCRVLHAPKILSLLRTACEVESNAHETDALLDLVTFYTVARGEDARRFFLQDPRSSALQNNASRIYAAILRRGDNQHGTDREAPAQPYDKSSVVKLADTLSIAYCAELLHLLDATADPVDSKDERFSDAIMQACLQHSDVWPQLLEFAGSTKSRIYGWALHELRPESGNCDPSSPESREHLWRCLDILAILKDAVPAGDNLAAIVSITERLKDLEKSILADEHEIYDGVLKQLSISLEMVCLFVTLPAKGGEALRNAKCQLLSTLCSLLIHPRLQTRRAVTEHVFDLASILSDSLPEETVEAIKRPDLALRARDPRVDSILGMTGPGKERWLAVVQQVHAASSMTQQQRALSKHASQLSPSPLALQAAAGAQWTPQHSHAHPSPGAYTQPGASPQSPQAARSPLQQLPPPPPPPPTSTHSMAAPQVHPQSGFPQSIAAQRLRQASLSAVPPLLRQDSRGAPAEIRITPFHVLPWELMSDPTPVMGANDSSLSLTLFGARKV